MLCRYSHIINNLNIILASASPRRQELCAIMGLKVTAIPSTFDESLIQPTDYSSLQEYIKELAYKKSINVYNVLSKSQKLWDIIISADTMIIMNDTILLGKPTDKQNAIETLRLLSGKTHKVCTGVTILISSNIFNASPSNRIDSYSCIKICETTKVTLADLTLDSITAYVESGEPLDKAGSYGIQGVGCTLVKCIEGDYFNVVGLPVHRIATELSYAFDVIDNNNKEVK